MTERSTPQLTAVLAAVQAERNHPTAQEVYSRVQRRLPRVSRGTVYRNLSKLHRQQRIRIVHLADQPARYDAVVEDHDHFVCAACGGVSDLSQAVGRNTLAPELSRSGYVVHAKSTTYYGICADCPPQVER